MWDYKMLQQLHPELFTNLDDWHSIKIITDEQKILEWQNAQKAAAGQQPELLSRIDIGVVYEDPYVIMIRDLVVFPKGNIGTYIRSVSPAGLNKGYPIAILPVRGQQILLLDIFRHATRSFQFEIPRGYGEDHVSAEENARMELKDETNWEAKNIIPLGSYNANTGIEVISVQLFLAKLDENESTEDKTGNLKEAIRGISYVNIPEFDQMIREGTIIDGFTIAAFTRAKLAGLIG
jgi:ADP-ribose pyrophosphatase